MPHDWHDSFGSQLASVDLRLELCLLLLGHHDLVHHSHLLAENHDKIPVLFQVQKYNEQ